ncbi:cobyrinic acid ac-diamide synthase [Halorubrum salipaludis]|uniref:Cobyrinic acid ac-diamide synthase n=1 Tax=Halorubrum salipaludis TaxID=2032630 RepID=A0A2A2FKP3_9EURY|nr:P-loop NTPase [Halorubrum salipaludis]PAU85334.1 cobyrinic acid ac-diamide synthase [Halorubrum salipaludis]
MATVYAVASAKGGVGKTTTTAAVATLLADSGADVVAIDADLGMANLAAAVGVPPGGITLHDVLAGAADPLDAVHEGPAGLRVVPGAADLDAYAAADPSGLRDVAEAFDDADYVLVDAGAGLSHDSTLPLGLADETLLVSTAERSALGDTEKTRQLTERLGGAVAGAAITRLDPATAASDDPIEAVEGTLDAPVIGRIPEDDAVLRAVESGQSLPVFAPDAPATRAYRDLTRALTGAPIEGPGLAAADVAAEEGTAASEDDSSTDAADEELDAEGSVADADGSDDPDEPAEPADSTEIDEAEGDETAPDEEDIIVADSERAGLGEPGDEEDIIVADESPVDGVDEAEPVGPGESDEPDEFAEPTDDDAVGVEPETADAEPASSGSAADAEADATSDAVVAGGTEAGDVDAVDGETETVGEGHVDGDDLEAMIESDLDAEQFDEEPAEPTPGGESSGDGPTDGAADTDSAEDATAAGPAETESPAEEGPTEPSRGDAPEAGGEPSSPPEPESVPDAETAPEPESAPAPSEGSEPDPDDELAGSVPFRDDDTGTMNTVLSEEEDDEDDEDENGGFFSRLLGR